MNEILNAQIKSTCLGIEDHGMFWLSLELDYGGSQQGYSRWQPTGEDIRRLLNIIGVDKWENLTGRFLRVKRQDGLIINVGNILKDVWFAD